MAPRRTGIHAARLSAVLLACLVVQGCWAGSLDPSPSDARPGPASNTSSESAEERGWHVTSDNIGLAGVGLSCEELPLYRGGSTVRSGTVISRMRITTPLVLRADVTIEESCIQPTRAWEGLPLVSTTDHSSGRIASGPVTIRDSEIDGSALDEYDAAFATGFIGVATLQRNHVHDVGSGIALMGTGEQLSAVVEGNYVDGLRAHGDASSTGNHSDAFTVRDFDATASPDRTLVVRNNRFDCDSSNCTGALFVQTYSGNIDRVTITGNLLEGIGYQLGLENGFGNSYSGLTATDNRFSGTSLGATYVDGGPGWTVWEDNHVSDPTAPEHRGTVVPQP